MKKPLLPFAVVLSALVAAIPADRVCGASSPPDTQPAGGPGNSTASKDSQVQIPSDDGKTILSLPSGWRKVKPKDKRIVLEADSPEGVKICIYSNPKIDYVSLDAYARVSHRDNITAGKGTESADRRQMVIGGRPAVRWDFTFNDGTYQWGCAEVFLEVADRYLEFDVIGLHSEFDKEKDQWAQLAAGLAPRESNAKNREKAN